MMQFLKVLQPSATLFAIRKTSQLHNFDLKCSQHNVIITKAENLKWKKHFIDLLNLKFHVSKKQPNISFNPVLRRIMLRPLYQTFVCCLLNDLNIFLFFPVSVLSQKF